MKRTTGIAILFVILLSASTNGFAQLSLSYYSSSLSKTGLGYDFNHRMWSELRIYSNTTIEDITPEVVFCYNVSVKESHNFYLGFGGNINYFSGFVFPAGIQFRPIQQFDKFSLHIEFQPTLDFSDPDIILQSSWGLRYKFGKKK